MAEIRPFCCVHPAAEVVSQVAALPYDVYNREEARQAVEGKPLSFLNIDRPETMFAPDQDMYVPEVYEAARQRLEEQEQAGVYVKEEQPVYYLYELTWRDVRRRTGGMLHRLMSIESCDQEA